MRDYLWQQDAPLPDMSGLTYGMPRDMPRRISSVASRKTLTGIAFSSYKRSAVGTSFPERLIASIIGTVPTPNAVIYDAPAKVPPVAAAPAQAT